MKQNNDQNIIKRVFTKMSDNFTGQNNNAKRTNAEENLELLSDLNVADDVNCQNAESEVNFFKDWLLYHLDLIQQQNEEILSKERIILHLKQENEKLKERLNVLEHGSSYQATKYTNSHKNSESLLENISENMTQDSGLIGEDDTEDIALVGLNCEINNSEVNLLDVGARHDFNILNEETNTENNSANPHTNQLNSQSDEDNIKLETPDDDKGNLPVNDNETSICNNKLNNLNNCNFTVHNSAENDSFNIFKMSIRRKRLCSNSSVVSNNDSNSDDKKNFRKSRKRRKPSVKSEKILTSNEQYVTSCSDAFASDQLALEVAASATSTTLEVPRWRVKVYTSCYTMEGTENLDDDVYNKRHIRLENDERRRKRWDVQRIREQRIIEKLKQRQERTSTGTQPENNDPIESLWPTLEDIKYLEVCDELPVSAFGCPVPRAPYSDFSLPWTNNPNIGVRKPKKSASRRSRTKR